MHRSPTTPILALSIAIGANAPALSQDRQLPSRMAPLGQYLGDGVGHWYPHLMFHIRTTSATTWGANVNGSPVMYNDQYQDMPEPETIFMIPVGHWSDGTAAPLMSAGM